MNKAWGIYTRNDKLLDNLGIWTAKEKAEEELERLQFKFALAYKDCYVECIKING